MDVTSYLGRSTITLERHPFKYVEHNKVLEHPPAVFPREYENVPEGFVMHSHTCMWPVSENWTNILSSRKNKIEMPMSLAIACISGYWHAKNEQDRPPMTYWWMGENKDPTDAPFAIDRNWYLLQLKHCEAREQTFLNGVKENTGKEAVIVYQEDTLEEIKAKLGPLHPHCASLEKHKKLSTRRPKDYILNYDELKEVYDDFIENKEYHMSIPFQDY
jgi:hypothetical protein